MTTEKLRLREQDGAWWLVAADGRALSVAYFTHDDQAGAFITVDGVFGLVTCSFPAEAVEVQHERAGV